MPRKFQLGLVMKGSELRPMIEADCESRCDAWYWLAEVSANALRDRFYGAGAGTVFGDMEPNAFGVPMLDRSEEPNPTICDSELRPLISTCPESSDTTVTKSATVIGLIGVMWSRRTGTGSMATSAVACPVRGNLDGHGGWCTCVRLSRLRRLPRM